jgi:hypothetical protein
MVNMRLTINKSYLKEIGTRGDFYKTYPPK